MVEILPHPPTASDIDALADILVDAVAGGGSVSFLAPLAREEAVAWWQATCGAADSRAIVLVVRDEDGIAGTVQIQPAWAPNQPHRADIAKLIVHRRARRRGLAHALMSEAERQAVRAGFTLLTLDTVRGDPAEGIYRGMGWTAVGSIPGYALRPDGTLCDTVVFYKQLTMEHSSSQPPYHVVRFADAAEADAFVRALQRFLASPRGEAFLANRDDIEVWSVPIVAGSPDAMEMYLNDTALAATTTAFPSDPASGTRRLEELPEGCTLVIGEILDGAIGG